MASLQGTLETSTLRKKQMANFNKFSLRSFYDKIKEWGYQKNVKAHDMQWIIAKRTERALEGKDTNFFFGSLPVTTEQIDNAERRKTTKRPLRICELFFS